MYNSTIIFPTPRIRLALLSTCPPSRSCKDPDLGVALGCGAVLYGVLRSTETYSIRPAFGIPFSSSSPSLRTCLLVLLVSTFKPIGHTLRPVHFLQFFGLVYLLKLASTLSLATRNPMPPFLAMPTPTPISYALATLQHCCSEHAVCRIEDGVISDWSSGAHRQSAVFDAPCAPCVVHRLSSTCPSMPPSHFTPRLILLHTVTSLPATTRICDLAHASQAGARDDPPLPRLVYLPEGDLARRGIV